MYRIVYRSWLMVSVLGHRWLPYISVNIQLVIDDAEKKFRNRNCNASDTTQLDSSVVTETDVIETDVVLETNDDNVNDDTSENVTAENVTVDHCGYCDELFDDAAELNSHMVLMHSIQKMIESSD